MSWQLDARVRSAMVSDSLDSLGIRNNAMDLRVRALRPQMRAVGIAATISFVRSDEYDVHDPYGDAINFLDTLNRDELVVVATGGETVSAFWGELFSAAAIGRGATGIVTDGPLRDTEQIVGLDFPAFGNLARPIDYKGRMLVSALRTSVECGGVKIENGDGVIADADGVVVVPQRYLVEVTKIANQRANNEKTVLKDLLAGNSVRQVWDNYGIL